MYMQEHIVYPLLCLYGDGKIKANQEFKIWHLSLIVRLQKHILYFVGNSFIVFF